MTLTIFLCGLGFVVYLITAFALCLSGLPESLRLKHKWMIDTLCIGMTIYVVPAILVVGILSFIGSLLSGGLDKET